MASEWISTTIGEQATLQRGFDITRAEQREGKIPVISSGGISSFHDSAMVKAPGVVLGRKGVVGSVYYIERDFWPHDTTLWVKDFHGNCERFVYYFFLHRAEELASLDVGSANPTLNRNHVHPITIKWPSVPTQQAIAHILGTLDDKIELLRSMNETLEAMARSLFKSWFIDFDPVRKKAEGQPTGLPPEIDALFPDSFVDSELGEIPKGWSVSTLGEVLEIAGGSTPSTKELSYWDGNYWFATPKDLSSAISSILSETERKITQDGVNQITSGQLPTGTLLLSSRAPIGYLAITAIPVSINQGFIAVKKESQLSPYYMYSWCKEYMETIIGHANGTTFLEISKTNFRTIKAVVPSSNLVDEYDVKVKTIFDFIESNTMELRNLTLMRDSLLPKLISGEIELSDKDISKIMEPVK